MNDKIVEAFTAGVDLYYSGGEPEGWRDESGRVRQEAFLNPYLAGWLFSGDADNGEGMFQWDAVNEALNEGRYDELHAALTRCEYGEEEYARMSRPDYDDYYDAP